MIHEGLDEGESVRMSGSNEKTRAGVLTKLGYIFDRRDKWKIAALLAAVVIGSFLELLGDGLHAVYQYHHRSARGAEELVFKAVL